MSSSGSGSSGQDPSQSWKSLVDGLPGAAYRLVVGDDGTLDFHFVSTACAEIFGFPAEAAMADAHHMHDSIHPLDRRSFREAGREALQQVTTLRWEGRIVRPDGAIRLVTITSRPEQRNGDTLWHGLVVDRTALAHWATNSGEAGDGPGRIDGDTLTILGHDIGTPLTAITAAAELAMEILESPWYSAPRGSRLSAPEEPPAGCSPATSTR